MPQVTGTKRYALVVDGLFACELRYPSIGTAEVEQTTAILQSNPKVVITDQSPVNNVNTYNLLIDNEVVGQINYIDNADVVPDPQMINAVLKSDPTIIDWTGNEMPAVGDIWDGETFIPQGV